MSEEIDELNHLPTVAGHFNGTLQDFERRCRVHLIHEQEKINPDNALIALLCDAVRVKREYCDYVKGLQNAR